MLWKKKVRLEIHPRKFGQKYSWKFERRFDKGGMTFKLKNEKKKKKKKKNK